MLRQRSFLERSRGCAAQNDEGEAENTCGHQGCRKHLQSWSEGYIIRLQIKTGELVKQAERK